jgi:hypothetical protein
MTTPAPPEPTAAELIAVVQACADEIDRRIRAASVKLEAATLATVDLPKLRDEVADLAHEMRSLRTAISAINDFQDKTTPPPPATKARR